VGERGKSALSGLTRAEIKAVIGCYFKSISEDPADYGSSMYMKWMVRLFLAASDHTTKTVQTVSNMIPNPRVWHGTRRSKGTPHLWQPGYWTVRKESATIGFGASYTLKDHTEEPGIDWIGEGFADSFWENYYE
jgi:hypothetical protein